MGTSAYCTKDVIDVRSRHTLIVRITRSNNNNNKQLPSVACPCIIRRLVCLITATQIGLRSWSSRCPFWLAAATMVPLQTYYQNKSTYKIASQWSLPSIRLHRFKQNKKCDPHGFVQTKSWNIHSQRAVCKWDRLQWDQTSNICTPTRTPPRGSGI